MTARNRSRANAQAQLTDDEMAALAQYIGQRVGLDLTGGCEVPGVRLFDDFTVGYPGPGPFCVELEIGASRILITIERR
jgi:hypothetical protein